MKTEIALLALGLVLISAPSPAQGQNYNQQALKQAHAQFHAATNSAMYADAAQQFEFLVSEEGLRNGKLFYTLGNSYFMAGDPGRAILNYRRAALYIPNNADLKHNLNAAQKLRTDLIPEKARHPLATRLLGWHIKTSTSLRGGLFAICWLLFWGACFWMNRSSRKEARITAWATGVLSAALLSSLATEYILQQNANPGVIVAPEVLARKGDGDRYAPAFLEPLHSGTEFETVEKRGLWRHIRLADGHTCWIPDAAAETVEL